MDYYGVAHEDGVLSAKTKQLIHICMTLAFRCEP
jgi:alkylhydroperoxidase/carboxymuconolactone decarboxylase family protein YurZ